MQRLIKQNPTDEEIYLTSQLSFLWIFDRLAMICETLAYADMAGFLSVSKNLSSQQSLEYALNDVIGRSLLEGFACCSISLLWLDTTRNAQRTGRLVTPPPQPWYSKIISPLLKFMLVFLIMTGLAAAMDGIKAASDGVSSSRSLVKIHSTMQVTIWGLVSLLMLQCVSMTTRRILSITRENRVTLLKKAVLPMVLAALVCLLRSIWLAVQLLHGQSTMQSESSSWVYWIGLVWLPTITLVLATLYAARKRDSLSQSNNNRANAADDNDLARPLLMSPVPPSEAFLSFRNQDWDNAANNDDEDEEERVPNDEESSLPTPQTPSRTAAEEEDGGPQEPPSGDDEQQHQDPEASFSNPEPVDAELNLIQCSSCGSGKPKSDFSKAQLKKPISIRKCKACIDSNNP